MTNTQSNTPSAAAAAPARYDAVAIALHWSVAAVVLTNLALGLYMGELARTDPMKFEIVQLHKSIGLLTLVLSLGLVTWRMTHRIPTLPAAMNTTLKFLAWTIHGLLYTLIVALPLFGWMMVSASPAGRPIPFFGLFNWPALWFLADLGKPDKKAIVGVFGEGHELLAWTMIALVAVHIAGALWHHFWARDNVLTRMLPRV